MSSWPKTTLFPILTALGISLVAGTLCKLLHIPLPWMLGPLFGVGLAAINGVKVGEIRGGRQAGQLIIGCALGLYFTPEVTRYLLGFWPYMLFASFASIGIGAISGYLQTRISGITYVTGYFASVPGGASEMAIMAERAGARFDQVALSHSIRILIVVATIPIGVTAFGISGDILSESARVAFDLQGMGLLVLAAIAAAFVFMKVGIPNAWILGPLLVSTAITMSGNALTSVPFEFSLLAQVLLGCALGTRFKPSLKQESRSLMVGIVASTFLTLTMTVSLGLAIAWLIGESASTMILSTSPGGLSEMCITAKTLHLGVALVTAFQVARLVVVVLFSLPIWRLMETIVRRVQARGR